MRKILKTLFYLLPLSLQRRTLDFYERAGANSSKAKLKQRGNYVEHRASNLNLKKKILFYHLSGLSFGGTEKFLQILAKHLDKEKYEVYFMYSPKPRGTTGSLQLDGRKNYLENSDLQLISFDYAELENKYPYFVSEMRPNILNVIEENQIDILISAGSGYSEFPMNVINIPILLLNIFGSPNVQPNILKNVCISNEVANRIRPIVSEEKIEVMYIPSERPPAAAALLGQKLRQSLGLQESDFVFGRIGRPDNNIFDPIGIEAFKKAVKKNSHLHYLIMSPPPILQDLVKREGIPNIHFLDPSSNEDDIWAFHFALDAMAHWRFDGESCGLNIIESMIAGRPIITHRSHLWNAQLEYLEPTFSRVAEKDNIEQYATFMEEFIELKKEGRLEALGEAARKKSEIFLIENNIGRFEKWLIDIL